MRPDHKPLSELAVLCLRQVMRENQTGEVPLGVREELEAIRANPTHDGEANAASMGAALYSLLAFAAGLGIDPDAVLAEVMHANIGQVD